MKKHAPADEMRKDLERKYKIEQEAEEYSKKLQAIKDEFEN